MALPKRPEAEIGALKALVTVYGPREAARVAGVPFGTVASYAFKYKWKKAVFKKPERKQDNLSGKDAGDILAETMEKHRTDSALHLAQYTARASKQAAKHSDPLEVARKVRDVAGVHQILFPRDEEAGLIEAAILIGERKPTINAAEIEAAKAETAEIIDVRAELPDQRPAGD